MKDDIIRMAREAGLSVGTNISGIELVGSPAEIGLNHLTIDELKRFAAVVAAAEREAIVKLVWNTPTQIDDEYVSPKDILTNAIRARGDA